MPSTPISNDTEEPPKKKREASPTYLMAVWFVTKIQGREWTETDSQGMHLKHARLVLDQYGTTTDIVGCIEAARDGLLGDVPPLKTLLGIRGGEPSLMDRWINYRDNPPPIYQIEETKEWEIRTGNVRPTTDATERASDLVRLPEGNVRDIQDPDSDRPVGRREDVAPERLRERGEDERVPGEISGVNRQAEGAVGEGNLRYPPGSGARVYPLPSTGPATEGDTGP